MILFTDDGVNIAAIVAPIVVGTTVIILSVGLILYCRQMFCFKKTGIYSDADEMYVNLGDQPVSPAARNNTYQRHTSHDR